MVLMNDSTIYKINLIEALLEDDESVPEPPGDAADTWCSPDTTVNQLLQLKDSLCTYEFHVASKCRSIEEIRAYFESGGTQVPTKSNGVPLDKLKEQFKPAPQETFQKWFPGIKISRTEQSNPKGFILCFSNAGNEENMYSSEGTGVRKTPSPLLDWCRDKGYLMLAVQLPGRAMRLKESFCESPQDLAKQLLPVVASYLIDLPYVVVAHSVGTLNTFEFLQHARSQGLPMPLAAYLSGFPAPDIPTEERPWKRQCNLNEEEFKVECQEWDINPLIFQPSMWGMYQPILRADFTLFDSYDFTHQSAPAFNFPFVTFWGRSDRRVTQAHVQQWQKFTSGDFECHEIEGNHLWPLEKEPKHKWLKMIADSLCALDI